MEGHPMRVAQIVPLHQAIPPRLHGGTERAAPRVRSTARRRAEDCLAACHNLAPPAGWAAHPACGCRGMSGAA